MTRINPALDPRELARQFKREHGRSQIRDFLSREDAEWTYQELAENTPWGMAFNDGERVEQFSAEQLKQLLGVDVAAAMQRLSLPAGHKPEHG